MHTGFLDMLHDTGNSYFGTIGDNIDVAFHRIAQILVHENRTVARHVDRGGDVIIQLRFAVDNFHCPAAEHVARTKQDRITDPGGSGDRFIAALGYAVQWLLQVQLVDQLCKAFAIFGKVDRVGTGAEDRNTLTLERRCQLQRGELK